MNTIGISSFFDELEKIKGEERFKKEAFDWKAMDKVRRLAKGKLVRFKVRPLHDTPYAIRGDDLPILLQSIERRLSKGYIKPDVAEFLRSSRPKHREKVFIPKGGVTRNHPLLPPNISTPAERKASDTMAIVHELNELKAKRIKGAGQYSSHVRPDVTLQERNQMLTLPKEVRSKVTDIYSSFRKGEAADFEKATRTISGKGLEWGSGPRLSRHARKRVEENIIKNTR